MSPRYTTVGGYPNTDPYYVSPEEEAAMAEVDDAQRAFEAAMAPRENPLHPKFRNHNCAYCADGERPCKQGNPSQCEFPRARNE